MHTHTHIYILYYIYIHTHIYKEFCVVGSKAKMVLYEHIWCYTVHIALQNVNSGILLIYRLDMCMINNWKAFKMFLSALTVMDKAVTITTKPVLSGCDVIYQQYRQNWSV